eukprot:467244_1
MAAAAQRRVLLVVSSFTDMPATETEKKENKTPDKTGWYLPEVAHPYYVFKENGYEITFVSPKGGLADCDVSSVNGYAKDPECQKFTKECLNAKSQLKTVKISEIKEVSKYDVILYAGGHGTMWDFPDDKDQNKAAADIYEAGGIVSAVCHGPAALINIILSNKKYLIDGKTVTGFTNDEENAVNKMEVMPFALETELKNKGAKFACVKNWGCNVEVSERLITGQNPASASEIAKVIVGVLEKKY